MVLGQVVSEHQALSLAILSSLPNQPELLGEWLQVEAWEEPVH